MENKSFDQKRYVLRIYCDVSNRIIFRRGETVFLALRKYFRIARATLDTPLMTLMVESRTLLLREKSRRGVDEKSGTLDGSSHNKQQKFHRRSVCRLFFQYIINESLIWVYRRKKKSYDWLYERINRRQPFVISRQMNKKKIKKLSFSAIVILPTVRGLRSYGIYYLVTQRNRTWSSFYCIARFFSLLHSVPSHLFITQS